MSKTRSTTAREVALDVLVRVEENQSYSNLELKYALGEAGLSKADVGLVTELVYGTIQRRMTLDEVIGQFVKGGTKKLQGWVLQLLRMSLYQVRFLDRVPDRAAVHEAVEIAKKRGHKGISSLVNGVLRNILRQPESWEKLPKGITKQIAVTESHPEWLVKRWVKQYGEETTREICHSNNQSPTPSIRVNRLRTTADALLQEMKEAFPEATKSELTPDALLLQSGHAAGSSWFQEGFYTIQDESSMLVAPALHLTPNLRVLDACAAPGGKTTHIAELMGNQGEILACDVHPHKRELIEQNAKRLGITIITTMVADAADLVDRNVGEFDRILLDAPCSGFGVIRRKPDLKWNKTAEDIKAISEIQYDLLERVAPLLKPDGYLVYSTCTIDSQENQDVVERFIAEHPEYELDTSLAEDLPTSLTEKIDASKGYVQILPHHFSSDGFFIARIKRVCK
ncbi:16S rRNA (cytosine(967)-C(5))-methyltransferase RsmB [Brevibacillus laterosporus]|uniref:16S rRNA (cytosine(967)-C(5))-methyltransferase RsmB n=1 Tax=Brevibacillus laterosporus TaxID=1465 RepID=UPI000839C75F|nr:16S rRNA (cytosine(967)-C(5))-methyltransferase RsmB [Brevibacillus laterosporus]